MAMVMIKGLQIRAICASEQSEEEHSTVERNSGDSHGWLSGAIRAMSANRPTRRRDHRKAGGFSREETTREHENIREGLDAHPQTDLSSRPILFEMGDQVNRTSDEKLGSQE
ncbi:hypothetical protein BO83DRAFT_440360 [Aspergillus eucalypticola CBS 122712]|uniref:Uncharacterized protein n=1 Tax=Aspergillus eucalypticola (strain CBS 122712 / IBT 29274) TaxID=1448314 RepID=A0A317UX06_ASPEC|nr:uncharacterized protein BO83DRAFT_440360 [Aspergillus eucalypticola CBS 122712]PWY65052.1 hypothetical protein BO83DRAFT_440360 [Aspergillus eucalypticola CBS 122712]